MSQSIAKIQVSRRALICAAAAGTAASTTGCIGSFGLTDSLYKWNLKVGDGKWLSWLVFLAFIILPIYSISLLVDGLILNSIEFWTGDNPKSSRTKDLGNGRTLHSSPTANENVVRHEVRHEGKVEQVLFVERVGENELRVLNKNAAPVVCGRALDDGGLELTDDAGQVQARLSQAECQAAAKRIRGGGSVAQHVSQSLESTGQLQQVRGASAHRQRRLGA